MCQHNLPCSTVYAHCLLLVRAFASLYVLLFLEKEAVIGGRAIGKRMLVVMLLLHYWVSMANLAKNRFAYQSQRILAKFMHILSLQRMSFMRDVSTMYLWRLHDECARYCYTPRIKIIQHSITSDPLWIRK